MVSTDHCRLLVLQYKSLPLHGSAHFTTVHITATTRQFTTVYYYLNMYHHSSLQYILPPLHRLLIPVHYYHRSQLYRSPLLPLQFTAVHTHTTDHIEVHLGGFMMHVLMHSGSTCCGTQCSQRYVNSRNIRRMSDKADAAFSQSAPPNKFAIKSCNQ